MRALLVALTLFAPAYADNDLIVHEWGTFTSVAGEDGRPVTWRPLNGPSDLPTFVYRRNDLQKLNLFSTVRMETPVIYFYTSRPMDVDVRVDFPGGAITEWYPTATVERQAIHWPQVRLRPGAEAAFPQGGSDSHYYPARKTNAVPLTVADESENLLFYRGVGTFDLPIDAMVNEQRVRITPRSEYPVGQLILFERDQSGARFTVTTSQHDPVEVTRPHQTADIKQVIAELRRMLLVQGLYEKEADAMLATWRSDWFEPGARLFYIVPPALTETVLPIRIEPAPTRVVRVLVGRMELLTPRRRDRVRQLLDNFDDPLAKAELTRQSRFISPILRDLINEEPEPTLRRRIQQLLGTPDMEIRQ